MDKREVLHKLTMIARSSVKKFLNWENEEAKFKNLKDIDDYDAEALEFDYYKNKKNTAIRLSRGDKFKALSRLLDHYEKMEGKHDSTGSKLNEGHSEDLKSRVSGFIERNKKSS